MSPANQARAISRAESTLIRVSDDYSINGFGEIVLVSGYGHDLKNRSIHIKIVNSYKMWAIKKRHIKGAA